MKINIASTNLTKIAALRETLEGYEMFRGAEITARKTDSGVSDQPKSLEETVRGAINRAKRAFHNCTYSFGIESGLMAVPHTKTGHMDMAVCAIYDGEQIHLGMSSAFECPIEVIRLVFQEGLDLNQASQRIGLTADPKIGDTQGLVGLVSQGHIMRKDYTTQAIKTALIHLQNPTLYTPSS